MAHKRNSYLIVVETYGKSQEFLKKIKKIQTERNFLPDAAAGLYESLNAAVEKFGDKVQTYIISIIESESLLIFSG